MGDTSKHHYGVLLVNTGTPDEPTPEAVKTYLEAFLMDERIMPMNRYAWWVILHAFILPRRSVASAKKYATIWTPEGSPFTLGHQWIAEHMPARLAETHQNVSLRVAMSYSHPFVNDMLAELREEGCDKLIVLPLYPQSASSTTGSVSDGVERGLKALNWDVPVEVIDNYHNNPLYIKAIADTVRNSDFKFDSDERLLFSFHSIPLNDIKKGDTYPEQVQETCRLIAEELGLPENRWAVGFQCRFDKSREWLSPFSRYILADWAYEPPSKVYMLCPNFVVDCLETFYDVGSILKPWYQEQLSSHNNLADDSVMGYIPCVGGSETQLDILESVLAPYLQD